MVCKGSRIIVPASARKLVIKEYHGQNHPGVDNTTIGITARYYWQKMRKQIEQFVSNCRTCSQYKYGSPPKAPTQDHKKVEKLFEMVSMDLGSMPLSENGNVCFLLVIDNFSKLMVAVALPDSTAFIYLHFFSSLLFYYLFIIEFKT